MNNGISGYLMLIWGHSPLILNFNSTFFLRGHVIKMINYGNEVSFHPVLWL